MREDATLLTSVMIGMLDSLNTRMLSSCESRHHQHFQGAQYYLWRILFVPIKTQSGCLVVAKSEDFDETTSIEDIEIEDDWKKGFLDSLDSEDDKENEKLQELPKIKTENKVLPQKFVKKKVFASEYEEIRHKNIEEKNKMLAELNIGSLKNSLKVIINYFHQFNLI